MDGDGDAAMNGEKKPVVPPALAFLTADELAAPVMPTKAEMEQILLEIRKKALLEEYLGKEG